MPDMTERFINEFLLAISDICSVEQVREIKMRMQSAFEEYVLKARKNELMNPNTDEAMEILKMFLLNKKVEGLSDKTLHYYKMSLRDFLIRLNKPVPEITANDIRMYIAKYKGTSSKSNQDNVRRIISSFFTWCTAEEYVAKNPSLRVKKIKGDKKVRKPFTEMEIEKLRDGCTDKRQRAMIDVMLSTGCRIAEICGMNRSDLQGDQLVVLGKGSKERWVFLNTRAQYSLEEYLKTRTDDNDALFVSELSPYNRLQIAGAEIDLRRLGKSVGVPDVHPHRFRHTAATMALNRGMPIEKVKEMLGHESINTTLIYAKTANESLKAAHKKYVV